MSPNDLASDSFLLTDAETGLRRYIKPPQQASRIAPKIIAPSLNPLFIESVLELSDWRHGVFRFVLI